MLFIFFAVVVIIFWWPNYKLEFLGEKAYRLLVCCQFTIRSTSADCFFSSSIKERCKWPLLISDSMRLSYLFHLPFLASALCSLTVPHISILHMPDHQSFLCIHWVCEPCRTPALFPLHSIFLLHLWSMEFTCEYMPVISDIWFKITFLLLTSFLLTLS